MKKKFTEEQVAYALKQAEIRTPVVEVIRKMGITEQTYYRWKKTLPSTVIGTFGRCFRSKWLKPLTPTPDFGRNA